MFGNYLLYPIYRTLNPRIPNSGHKMHLPIHRNKVARMELTKIIIAAGASDDLHQLVGCIKKIMKLLGGGIYNQPTAQGRFLGCNTDRTEIRGAGAHAQTSYCLYG